MSTAALETFLQPVLPWLHEEGVTDIAINGPGEVWIEKHGALRRIAVPEMDASHLIAMGRLIAEWTHQDISAERPLLSATLPSGHRVQVVFPPVSQEVCLSIRRPYVTALTLDRYEAMGAFRPTAGFAHRAKHDEELAAAYHQGDFRRFLQLAVRRRKNILISGGTSSGKTTFLNACLREVPATERLVTIEDAREVVLLQPNSVHLLVSRGQQGQARVTIQQLLEATLRLRPDRIILGELRGAEAFAFLRAINTGHPGSIATLHADSPAMAFEQVALMAMQSGVGLDRAQVMAYIRQIIDVVVQLRRDAGGQRVVSEIYYSGAMA